jgi:hypothetical protein
MSEPVTPSRLSGSPLQLANGSVASSLEPCSQLDATFTSSQRQHISTSPSLHSTGSRRPCRQAEPAHTFSHSQPACSLLSAQAMPG